MKKPLLIGLACLLLFSFTQCKTLKVSKEYKDYTDLLKQTENAINKASDCDELKSAVLYMAIGVMAMQEYTGAEKMSKKEEKKLMKYTDEVQALYDKKAANFGCEDEDDEDE